MGLRKRFLFVLALFVESAGFLLGYADAAEWVIGVLSAEHRRAIAGRDILYETGSLKPNQPGFTELAEAIREWSIASGWTDSLPSGRALEIKRDPKAVPIGLTHTELVIQFIVMYPGNKILYWDSASIEKILKSDSESVKSHYSLLIFILGLIMLVVERALPEEKSDSTSPQAVPQETQDEQQRIKRTRPHHKSATYKPFAQTSQPKGYRKK